MLVPDTDRFAPDLQEVAVSGDRVLAVKLGELCSGQFHTLPRRARQQVASHMLT